MHINNRLTYSHDYGPASFAKSRMYSRKIKPNTDGQVGWNYAMLTLAQLKSPQWLNDDEHAAAVAEDAVDKNEWVWHESPALKKKEVKRYKYWYEVGANESVKSEKIKLASECDMLRVHFLVLLSGNGSKLG